MISSVNGKLFKRMMMNGAINLSNHHKEIDQLNVFPVPDGDTGTNMKMTMMTGVKEMTACESSSIIDIAKKLQRGLLMGARGNSGVILSQFFRGIYVGLKEMTENEISVDAFIDCLCSGKDVAYKAVMEPIEGTILTVVREAAEVVAAKKGQIKSYEELFELYLTQARKSLSNTPNLLPVLKEAGVVDSGGAGFIKVIEGMEMAIHGVMLESNDSQATGVESAQAKVSGDIKYGYCTEFIIELKNDANFQESDLRSPLSMMGDSLVLVHDDGLVKVHVHVNKPGQVLELAQNFGEFVKIKVENMRLQHSELINAKPEETKPQEKKKFALVAVCFGDGIKQIFTDLGVDYIIDGGQTMNPSTEEFVKAVKACNAENIIIIPNNGNVILSAEQSTKLCDDANIRVLKAKTIAQGYASLMAFDSSNDLDTNYEDMTEAISNVQTGEVTYAVRDTEIKGVKIKAGDYMGICNGEIEVSVKERLDATKILLDKCVNEDSSIVTIFRGVGTPDEEIEELKEHCTELNEDVEVEVIDGNQDIYSYIIAVEA